MTKKPKSKLDYLSKYTKKKRKRENDIKVEEPAPEEPPSSSIVEEPSPIKRRYDSDDEEPRRKRYDSDDEEPLRKRYDSEDEKPPRKRYDSEDEGPRMSSGHKAGLQSGTDFSKEQSKIERKNHQQAQDMINRHGTYETVHRKSSTTSKRELTPAEQAALQMGSVQKDLLKRQTQNLQNMKESTFARYADDVDEHQKAISRKGDPMADYGKKQSRKSTKTSKFPVYKGPQPKPNRFGIRPGFRWDGVDRGNGFEDKLLARQYSKQHQQERAYRHSVADM